MTPEHIVLQMTDGTQFDALVSVESGKLHMSAGGFMGLTFVIDPDSAKQVCYRILELLTEDAPKIRERTPGQ